MTLTDGKTRAIAYPHPGYNCNPDYALQKKKPIQSFAEQEYNDHDMGGVAADVASLEHCPDAPDRTATLKDGKTKPNPYPNPHYNCRHHQDGVTLDQKDSVYNDHDMGGVAQDVAGLPRCPDERDKSDLLPDGKTRAIAYPKPHYNCKNHWNGVTLLPPPQSVAQVTK